MEFDVDTIINDMVLAVRKSVQNDYEEAEIITRLFVQANKARYKKLADYRLLNKINEQTFKSRLEDEKLMLEAQFNTLSIFTKVMAQNAANAVIDGLEKAILSGLKII